MEEEEREDMSDATSGHGPTESLAALRDAIDSPLSGASVIADDDHSCAFADLRELISRIQAHLAAADVRPSDCVTLELANTVPSALLALACLDGGNSLVLAPMDGLGSRAIGLELHAPRFSRWIATISGGVRAGRRNLRAPETYVVVRPNPDYDPATASAGGGRLYFRTSGSLGTPKIVAWSMENFLTNVRHARERIGLSQAHRVALPIPIFYSFGFGAAFLGCVFGAASVDLQHKSNLLRYLERERRFEPNVALMTPSFCEILVRGRRTRRPYELVLTGGDRISRSTFSRCEELHGPLINAYGCSEIGFVLCGDLGMPFDLRCRTVGRPLPGVEVRVAKESEGTDAAVGRLQLRYRYHSEGYVDVNGVALGFGRALLEDDWYDSSDLARQGPDGTVEVLGRCDLSVKRNGMLLPFADLEAVLRELAGIEDAGVAAGPEGIRGRMLVGYCAVGSRGSARPEGELRAELAERVPSFAMPERIRAVPALPRLPNGKIDRTTLARWALAETVAVAPGAA